MQINTKFSIGDFVRVIDTDKVFCVQGIYIYAQNNNTSIRYRGDESYNDLDCGENYVTYDESRLKKVKIIDEL